MSERSATVVVIAGDGIGGAVIREVVALAREMNASGLAALDASIAEVAASDAATPDLGGTATTRKVGDAVRRAVMQRFPV